MMEFYMTPDIYDYDAFSEIPTTGADAFGVAGFLFGFLAIFYFAVFALSIVMYIFQSIGVYTVAKRRGINNPWLAWVPVGVLWIIGSISDQYQYVAKGRVRNRRKILLGVEIALLLLLLPLIISTIVLIVAVVEESVAALGISGIILLLSYLAIVVLAIIETVFAYMAMYDLYASCDPNNATTYLVLSILFPVAQPFFMFFSRKKDLGMPPRKTETQPAAQPVLPVVEQAPVVEEIPVETPEIAETPEETE